MLPVLLSGRLVLCEEDSHEDSHEHVSKWMQLPRDHLQAFRPRRHCPLRAGLDPPNDGAAQTTNKRSAQQSQNETMHTTEPRPRQATMTYVAPPVSMTFFVDGQANWQTNFRCRSILRLVEWTVQPRTRFVAFILLSPACVSIIAAPRCVAPFELLATCKQCPHLRHPFGLS